MITRDVTIKITRTGSRTGIFLDATEAAVVKDVLLHNVMWDEYEDGKFEDLFIDLDDALDIISRAEQEWKGL